MCFYWPPPPPPSQTLGHKIFGFSIVEYLNIFMRESAWRVRRSQQSPWTRLKEPFVTTALVCMMLHRRGRKDGFFFLSSSSSLICIATGHAQHTQASSLLIGLAKKIFAAPYTNEQKRPSKYCFHVQTWSIYCTWLFKPHPVWISLNSFLKNIF